MAYCPECLVEYAQGSPECIDCRVPLISGPPTASGRGTNRSKVFADLDLVAVRSFMGATASLNATLARNLLDTHGILSTIMGENISRVFPLHCLVLLLVERKNLAQSTEILESYLDNSEAQPAGDEYGFEK